ncbi:MAG: hypothetical protein ABIX01_21070 [Chitinophagaceae bacterium]
MLNASKNDYDWLGNGMYFWENNQQRALNFATDLKDNPSNKSVIQRSAVIGAIIDMGVCLDLTDASGIKLVLESYETLRSTCKFLGLEMPANKGTHFSNDLLLRNLDCAVIENLHIQRAKNNLRPFDSVKRCFCRGQPTIPKCGV